MLLNGGWNRLTVILPALSFPYLSCMLRLPDNAGVGIPVGIAHVRLQGIGFDSKPLVLTYLSHESADPPLSAGQPVPDPLSRPRQAGLVDVVHRACDGRRAVPRQWWSRPGWRATTRGMALVVAPPTARLGHWSDVQFGLLKPISFIPWLHNGPIGPKGSYPNRTKPRTRGYDRSGSNIRFFADRKFSRHLKGFGSLRLETI